MLKIKETVNKILQSLIATEYTAFTYGSNFAAYATSGYNQPKATKYGKIVMLTGAVKPTSQITSSDTEVTMFTLPSELTPANAFRCLQQGSSLNKFLLAVNPNGQVRCSRYGGTSYVNIPSGAWLNISCVFVCQ